MKRIICIVLMLALPVMAHVGDYIYSFPEIPDEALDELDVRDRSLEDWKDIGLYPLLTATDFYADPTVGEGAAYNPDDLDYRIWLGWNGSTSRLYGAMERIDDVFVNEYAGGNLGDTWRHDGSFEFMVDGDHSGGNYSRSADPEWTEEERNLNHNRTAQLFTGIADAPDGQHISYAGAHFPGPGNPLLDAQWVTQPPYADASGGTVGEAPVISTFEFYVTPFDDLLWNNPEDSKPSELFPGKIIGFAISIADFDTEPGHYRAFHSLSEVPGTWHLANAFVDARLISAQGTHVENDTWARIKAAFRSD